MANFEKKTKTEIQSAFKEIDGIESAYFQKALSVYEKTFPIYDEATIKGIMFRLGINDKLKSYRYRNHRTIFESRSEVKDILQRMGFITVQIDLALGQYDQETVHDPRYHLEDIVDMIFLNCGDIAPVHRLFNINVSDLDASAPEDVPFRVQSVKTPEGYNEDTSTYHGTPFTPCYLSSPVSPIKLFEQYVIESETKYYQDLNTLLSQWILPMFLERYISPKYMINIRSSLPAIIEFHDGLLTALNTLNTKQSMAKAFDRFMTKNSATLVEIYTSFAADYNDMLHLFGTTLHKEKWLGDFIKRMMRTTGKSLVDYLIVPIRRISAYVSMLHDWKQCPNSEHGPIDHALSIIATVANIIDKEQNKVKGIAECLAVQQSLNGLQHPIVDGIHCRQFENKFELRLIEKDAVIDTSLFVFNDIVIMVNSDDNTVRYVFDVRAMDIKRDVDGVVPGLRFTMITGVTKPMVFVSDHKENIAMMQHLIQTNRYDILAQDGLNVPVPGSGGAILQNHLAYQLASVL